MERSVMSLSLLVLACLLGSAAAQSAEHVDAHREYIRAKEHNWNMNEAEVQCRNVYGTKPYEWRSKYNWTNIAASIPADCGKCILVTNPANKKEAIVRIVGSTGNGLGLDEPVFNELDNFGTGRDLSVNYKFVDCDHPVPAGPGESKVTARYVYYSPKENDWKYPVNGDCTKMDGGKSLEWRKRYGWTAYCGNYSSKAEDICGKCLKVTNSDTKDEVVVRIMDACGGGDEALNLDYETAFNVIDTDRKGYHDGHLTVDYEFVNCDDHVDVPLLLYSE